MPQSFKDNYKYTSMIFSCHSPFITFDFIEGWIRLGKSKKLRFFWLFSTSCVAF